MLYVSYTKQELKKMGISKENVWKSLYHITDWDGPLYACLLLPFQRSKKEYRKNG